MPVATRKDHQSPNIPADVHPISRSQIRVSWYRQARIDPDHESTNVIVALVNPFCVMNQVVPPSLVPRHTSRSGGCGGVRTAAPGELKRTQSSFQSIHACAIPALPEPAEIAMPPVVPACHCSLPPCHRSPQIDIPGFECQVVVIAHQAPRKNCPTIEIPDLTQNINELEGCHVRISTLGAFSSPSCDGSIEVVEPGLESGVVALEAETLVEPPCHRVCDVAKILGKNPVNVATYHFLTLGWLNA